MPLQSTASVLPEPQDVIEKSQWVPTSDEEERGRRVHKRIDDMLEFRAPQEIIWKRAMLNYEGVSRENPDDPRDEQVVAPFAFIFVEAKTAEEVKTTHEYQFTAVEEAGDQWKVDLLNDVNKHVQRKTKIRSKLHQVYRDKNLFGTSIVRVGYRRTMRVIKERILGDMDGEAFEWEEREVPVYDDIFIENVSPYNFLIDPNATTMDDAEDCAHFHIKNWDTFNETYTNDKRYKNTEHVRPGIFHKFGERLSTHLGNADRNQVLMAEYFSKMRDEWITYANGIEIRADPLPDDHKELPFVSFHNHANYATGYWKDFFDLRSPSSGKQVAPSTDLYPHQMFWTRGDPELLRDLIDLRTGFARSAFRAAKLAGESIVATQGTFRFDERKEWRSGDQAVGAMGRFQVQPLGQTNAPSFQFMFNIIDEMMILSAGVDPRILADQKTKTATEAAVQRETALRRLEENIEFNEENGMLRLGKFILQLIQQYYTIPELVRITGKDGKEDIAQFHDVINDPKSGKPIIGKRFRRIKTSRLVVEKKGKSGKMTLIEDDGGVNSFIARPDYIRTSDIDVAIDSARRIGQIRAVQIEQAFRGLELFMQLVPLTQTDAIKMEDLPDLKFIIGKVIESLGWSRDMAVGQKKAGGREEELVPFQSVPLGDTPVTDQ